MKRRVNKLLATLLCVVMLVALAAACANDTTGTAPATDAPATGADTPAADTQTPAQPGGLEEVTLKIVVPGDRPHDMDMILAAAEERMKDALNVKIDMVFVPWSDLGSDIQMRLTSGEVFDLCFNAPWLHMNEMIAAGYYEPLDDLIAEYGPYIVSRRSQEVMDANRVNGILYGVPLGEGLPNGTRQYTIRKDIREKLGFEPIESFDKLVEFWYAGKENEPGMVPFSTQDALDMSMAQMRMETNYDLKIQVSGALPASMILYIQDNGTTVKNMFDDRPDAYWQYILDARQFYTDGIIYPDLLAGMSHQDLLIAGQAASIVINQFALDYTLLDDVQSSVPGAELEAFVPYLWEPGENISLFQMWNFQCIPITSQNKERAIMFINYINENQDLYDLLSYGIPGVHWNPVGTHSFEPIGDGFPLFNWAWFASTTQGMLNARWTEREIEMSDFLNTSENFVPSNLIGFTFDPEPVANELTIYITAQDRYLLPLYNGLVDPETTWEAFKADAYDAVKTIQIEQQRQIDAFLAGN